MPGTKVRTSPAMAVMPDRGCRFAPKCVTCPWSTCLLNLPSAEQARFTAALKTLRPYLPAPDRDLG